MTAITEQVLAPPYRARAEGGTLAFELREPWYRSLPVSCIEALQVSADGKDVPPDGVTITINGVERSLAECAAAWEEFWFVQDPATVTLHGFTAEDRVRIGVHLVLRIPYIMVGPKSALPRHIVQEEVLEVTR